ncbi:hypothetical protein SPRG_05169 [Saprolegnia parasitica CBS 223.65]|uniref:Uncharacterized protein n=1 Tax=Saprolegnia parasitica (strain CBS 223.65) TaxID=695850 RepID=A0A067CL88_SAPPC|nr:hypothetical protein SPRG_05169 [Saprolegnia parasitica CBS 223.65]KDO29980.1 hypothetical protein SPRG_05169 [Saprolegnia parasitica CBS 223.65]|eukprot:XP_012199163.1 hypothetical protein SPRG_05169 [Saprolegnia parasitica CBS 223.65]
MYSTSYSVLVGRMAAACTSGTVMKLKNARLTCLTPAMAACAVLAADEGYLSMDRARRSATVIGHHGITVRVALPQRS